MHRAAIADAGGSALIAEVVINSNTKATDNIYHYLVPVELESTVQTGMRVVVPFGRGNKTVEAFVIGFADNSDFKNLKEIAAVNDEYCYFDDDAVKLIKFMVHRYFCSFISAIKCIIPIGVGSVFKRTISLISTISQENLNFLEHSVKAFEIYTYLLEGSVSFDKLSQLVTAKNLPNILNTMKKRGIISIEENAVGGLKDTTKKRVELIVDYEDVCTAIDSMIKRAPARARCLEILSDENDILLSDLLEIAETSKSVVDQLEKSGFVRIYETVERDDIMTIDYEVNYIRHELNEYQQNVCNVVMESISSNQKNTYLLNGVTGSGKTEVYLELIEQTVKQGREAIFLVPEISLTPQMVSQVNARFGDRIAVMHSSLTQKQRFEQWKRINEGEVDIVVGARSAIFAPFKNLGLIIIDEEHENTYKSEFSPKYSAVEIAKFRANISNSVVLLASATPLIESTFKAEIGKYIPLSMPKRVNDTPLPTTHIVDMRKEMENGNMGIFSTKLLEEIAFNLENHQQTILFLNRRGFSSFVSCRTCGYVVKCPNCNVSLTYHKSIGKMICHYCDYAEKLPHVCPECSGKYIKHFGIGTQKVADEIAELFPTARVLRMDADTTSAKMSHETLLRSFKNRETDILIGTQMITKGLDFDNVTLVGVVAADMSLNIDDFRAAERTYDLITQVTGRAGRGKLKGRSVIQTYNPDNETILCAAAQNYRAFYNDEIELRKLLVYPPFCEFINFVFSSDKQQIAKTTSNYFYNDLKRIIGNNAILYAPGEAPLFKVNNNYRYRFLIKTRYSKKLYDDIYSLYKKYVLKKNSSKITIDVNPVNMY